MPLGELFPEPERGGEGRGDFSQGIISLIYSRCFHILPFREGLFGPSRQYYRII